MKTLLKYFTSRHSSAVTPQLLDALVVTNELIRLSARLTEADHVIEDLVQNGGNYESLQRVRAYHQKYQLG